MNFDIRKVPFSFYGSYYVIQHLGAWEEEKDGLYLRSVYKGRYKQKILTFELIVDGKPVPFSESACPAMLTLEAGKAGAEICFTDTDIVQFRTKGAGLRITMFKPDAALPGHEGNYRIACSASGVRVSLTALKGTIDINTGWDGDNATHVITDFLCDAATGEAEGVIELFNDISIWNESSYKSFEDGKKLTESEFTRWLAATPAVPERYSHARELAAYLNWSSMVKPLGNLARGTMYTSKNWMSGIWSWDQCFHAIATVSQDPHVAWDQLMLVFDKQDAYGGLPDTINEAVSGWGFVKPPVHGWTLDWIMQNSAGITKQMLEEVYEPLCRWTNWWFTYKDSDKDGVPEYHNGNDSGWDNSTVFYDGIPCESPDLSTHLILQMETLAKVAGILGRPDESNTWKLKSEELLGKMLEHFWNGTRFVARISGSHKKVVSNSLLLYVPLLLGKRLPEHIIRSMVNDLKQEGRFLSPYGLATEALDSKLYEKDSYWRGPVWAPPMLFICHALKEVGEAEFSKDLAERFCNACAESGFAENFDPVTGEPFRDPTIIWTSSIFLTLASKYL